MVLKLSLHWSKYWLSKSLAMLFSLYYISQFLYLLQYVGVTCQTSTHWTYHVQSLPIFLTLFLPLLELGRGSQFVGLETSMPTVLPSALYLLWLNLCSVSCKTNVSENYTITFFTD